MSGGASLKVAVVGSRGIARLDLSLYLPPNATEIVSGGARGVDSLAAEYARKMGLPLREFLPNYTLFGKRAPLIRNEQIARYCDVLYAFWDGKSTGTQHAMRCALELDKPVYYVRLDGAKPEVPLSEDDRSRPIEDFF